MKEPKHHIPDKRAKTKVLMKSRKLSGFVPETRLMSPDSLLAMLHKYGMVYIKPCYGSEGRGVMKIEKVRNADLSGRKGSYRYQLEERIFTFSNFEAAYRSIRKGTNGKSYLVQKGIHLLTYGKRPFDIRLMVQKNLQGFWKVTGAAGRVAHPRKIVTNGSQGGTIYPVEYLLKEYASPRMRRELVKSMNHIGIAAAKQLYNAYPGVREIGLDIALDRQLKPWILEANTMPDPCPFTKLKDKSMLHTIIRYGKAFGRKYNLHCTRARRGSSRN